LCGGTPAQAAADIVFWRPQFFGIKPEVAFKGGFAVWSATGEANASLRYCEPTCYKPMWGAYGPAIQDLSMTFMVQAAVDSVIAAKLRLNKKCVGTRGTRKLTKKDMLWNDALPVIKVDPETYRVEIDGELAICKPMIKVPLGRLYMFKY
jgi:urease subunit alpha